MKTKKIKNVFRISDNETVTIETQVPVAKPLNEYASCVIGYNKMSKDELAAIAFSFALRLSEDNFQNAADLVGQERKILKANRII
jgi:hypothetical protein